MSPALLFIALLLAAAYWRHLLAALTAGAVVLACLGLVYVAIALGAAHAGPGALLG